MSPMDEIKENVYMRAIVVTHSTLDRLSDDKVFGSRRLRTITNDSDLGASYGSIIVECGIEPPTEQIRRVVMKKQNGNFAYRLHLADIPIGEKRGILVASPVKEIIPIALPKLDFMYATCNLRKMFNDQFYGASTSAVTIARLNARVLREDTVESVALYGSDLLTSQTMKDILGDDLISDKGGPFTPRKQGVDLRIDPNSCRLVWDDGGARSFGLNLDRQGNFSFFMRDTNDLRGLMLILNYINSIRAIQGDNAINPIRQSTKALERVAT